MGLFDSIKAIFSIKENKHSYSSDVHIHEVDVTSPFSIAGFAVKPQDEAVLKKLIDKYTTSDTEQVFYESYGHLSSNCTRGYSNSEVRVKAEYIIMHILYDVSSNRQWVRDSTKIESFFSNYDQLLLNLQSLIEFEPYFPFEKPLPHELLSEYIANKDKLTRSFIERWFESILNGAASLKTVDGKKKRLNKEFDSFTPFFNAISDQNALLIDEKRQLISEINLESIEKKEKSVPDFDNEKERELLNVAKSAKDNMDLHFCYIGLQDFYYKYRKDEKYLNLCIDYCLKDLEIVKTFENFIGTIPAFKRMAIIEENKKNYDKAIDYCNMAIEHYKKQNALNQQLEFIDRKNKLVDKKAKYLSK